MGGTEPIAPHLPHLINHFLGNRPHLVTSRLGGQQRGSVVNKLRVKDNTRGQYQIQLTTPDGTITCVVTPGVESNLRAERRDAALALAKRLAKRLDGEIKPARAMDCVDIVEADAPRIVPEQRRVGVER